MESFAAVNQHFFLVAIYSMLKCLPTHAQISTMFIYQILLAHFLQFIDQMLDGFLTGNIGVQRLQAFNKITRKATFLSRGWNRVMLEQTKALQNIVYRY